MDEVKKQIEGIYLSDEQRARELGVLREIDWNDPEAVVRAVWTDAVAHYVNCGYNSYWRVLVDDGREVARVYCGALAGDKPVWAEARQHPTVQAWLREHGPKEPKCCCGGYITSTGYCPIHMPSKAELSAPAVPQEKPTKSWSDYMKKHGREEYGEVLQEKPEFECKHSPSGKHVVPHHTVCQYCDEEVGRRTAPPAQREGESTFDAWWAVFIPNNLPLVIRYSKLIYALRTLAEDAWNASSNVVGAEIANLRQQLAEKDTQIEQARRERDEARTAANMEHGTLYSQTVMYQKRAEAAESKLAALTAVGEDGLPEFDSKAKAGMASNLGALWNEQVIRECRERQLRTAHAIIRAKEEEIERLREFGQSWHRAMETLCTILGVDFDLMPHEIVTAIRDIDDANRAAFASLKEKADVLVIALDKCQPAIDGAFVLQALHGGKYNGPTYGVELEALRAALTAPTEEKKDA